jgi:hypothetical protein
MVPMVTSAPSVGLDTNTAQSIDRAGLHKLIFTATCVVGAHEQAICGQLQDMISHCSFRLLPCQITHVGGLVRGEITYVVSMPLPPSKCLMFSPEQPNLSTWPC